MSICPSHWIQVITTIFLTSHGQLDLSSWGILASKSALVVGRSSLPRNAPMREREECRHSSRCQGRSRHSKPCSRRKTSCKSQCRQPLRQTAVKEEEFGCPRLPKKKGGPVWVFFALHDPRRFLKSSLKLGQTAMDAISGGSAAGIVAVSWISSYYASGRYGIAQLRR